MANLEELSKKQLSKDELERLTEISVNNPGKASILSSEESDNETDLRKRRKTFRNVKTKLQLFEKLLSFKLKGSYRV